MAIVVLAFTLAGCAQQQLEAQRKAALARHQATTAACATQFPSEVGNYAAKAKCINDLHRQYLVDANATDGDLVEIELAARTKLGAMLDQREISKEDANLQFAQIHSNLVQIANERQASRNAAQTARAAALMPYLMQQQQISNDNFNAGQQRQVDIFKAGVAGMPYNPPSVSCNRIGTMVTCN